mmetsp:Transcript_40960/g.132182  ORF Transcript_40960/g.132182 Transcript_40960/m.132182 type:complete len:225 (+) Transcript_40960:141-815(+)
MRNISVLPEPSSATSSLSPKEQSDMPFARSAAEACAVACATLPLRPTIEKSAGVAGGFHDLKSDLKSAGSAPSLTFVTRTPLGRPAVYLTPVSMPPFFSSAVASLPTHTKTSASLSTMKTSFESSIDRSSVSPHATSVVLSEPEASDTRTSLSAPLELPVGESSGVAAATGPCPPSASQKAASSAPWSHAVSLARPPRSSSLMARATSRPLAFSLCDAPEPFHR